ncbi:Cna B-type domain-containing protein [Sharpea azabuensis]|uniref:Cna B-type domain-containing protein n=1 Tax=Sharpea azabuensis TaxID=322505 RepID=UPI00051B0FFB|nr:Cna B-type domain-containing protein [Sharpea azabuensis]
MFTLRKMRKSSNLFKKLCIILSLLLIMVNAQGKVFAKESSTLTLTKCQSGMHLHLYHVANKINGEFVYTQEFLDAKNANIDLNKLPTADDTQKAAETLKGYAINKEGQDKEANGDVVKYNGLQKGVYLLIIDNLEKDHQIYRYLPYLIDLSQSTEVELSKYSLSTVYKYRLLKKWEGTNNPPDRIVVDIYGNGIKEKTVNLTKKQNYFYSWQDHQKKNYTVVEHHVKGYKNSVVYGEKDGEANIVLTNTKTITQKSQTKTGDATPIMFYVILLSISGIVLIMIGKKCKR